MTELERLCEELGVEISAKLVDAEMPEGFDPAGNAWTVEIRYDGRTMETPYYTGSLAGEPEPADVMYSLVADSSALDETFEDWCGEFGYDTDSRRALATYEGCRELGAKVRELVGSELERFQGAEH